MHELLEPGVAARVIFDLGLVRNIGYYTGAVFDVYDPALGAPIGGGGRYDELLGRFGRRLPAVGFALGVDRLHIALAGEERGTGALLARADGAGAVAEADAASRRDERPRRPHDRRAARRAVRRTPSSCSPALGLDTDELRSNDRKLLFEDIGVITMRPSDVPTYVEAGAADLGITGKDVLLEQAGEAPRRAAAARSTSCSTSATGAARWCSPARPAPTRPLEALRRLA